MQQTKLINTKKYFVGHVPKESWELGGDKTNECICLIIAFIPA
jgi:hypothetical protein